MEILGLEKRKSIAHGPFLRKLLKDVLQHIKGGGKTRRRCGARETGIPGRREEGGGRRRDVSGPQVYSRSKEK